MLAKVFPINLKPGKQAEVEAIVEEFAPKGPEQEPGTLSFRVYRDPARPDYLLFVEHFADQAAYDAHTGSAAYKELIAGKFAEPDHGVRRDRPRPARQRLSSRPPCPARGPSAGREAHPQTESAQHPQEPYGGRACSGDDEDDGRGGREH